MTPFFIYFLNSNCLRYSFLYLFENCQNSFSWGPPFGPFWFGKYLNFGSKSCEIGILSRFDSRSILIKKSKKSASTLSIELKSKFVWSHGLILLSTHLKQGSKNRTLETEISKTRIHKSKPQNQDLQKNRISKKTWMANAFSLLISHLVYFNSLGVSKQYFNIAFFNWNWLVKFLHPINFIKWFYWFFKLCSSTFLKVFQKHLTLSVVSSSSFTKQRDLIQSWRVEIPGERITYFCEIASSTD